MDRTSAHHPHDADQLEDHDRGLQFDLGTMFSRRRLLGMFAGVGAVALAACGSDSSSGSTASTSAATDAATASTTASTTAATTATTAAGTSAATASVDEVVPEETGGPFPGDGSNGPNVLTQSGVVRSDIRTRFGEYTGTSTGVPMTLTMTVLDSSNGFAPLANGAVYIWHADQDGRYSLYSDGVTDQNYLRGVQETDANGQLTFITNFPSCYDGRWPHIHFEVYPSLEEATTAGSQLATSQLAMPEDVCNVVFATDSYSSSAQNLTRVSLSSDNVFSDGVELETPTLSGDVTNGYTATYTCAV